MRIVIVLAAFVLMGGQAGSQPFAGTWTADLAGQTCVRLELNVTNGALGGRISLGNIHVDAEGEIDQVNSVARNFTPSKTPCSTDHCELHVAPDGSVRLMVVPTEEDRAEPDREGIRCPSRLS